MFDQCIEVYSDINFVTNIWKIVKSLGVEKSYFCFTSFRKNNKQYVFVAC